MIWWLLLFGLVAYWLGVRIGAAFDDLDGPDLARDYRGDQYPAHFKPR